MRPEPSGPWLDPMIRAKAVDPRNGRPSWNGLANVAKVSTSTITAMIDGKRSTSVGTIAKVADALKVDREDVSEWIGFLHRPVRGPYVPPAVADQLSDRVRDALDELIRAIVAVETDTETKASRTTTVKTLSQRKRSPRAPRR